MRDLSTHELGFVYGAGGKSKSCKPKKTKCKGGSSGKRSGSRGKGSGSRRGRGSCS
jgi:hypothetical protein